MAKRKGNKVILLVSILVLLFTFVAWIRSRGGLFGSPFDRARKFHLRNRGGSAKENLSNFNKAVQLYQEDIEKKLEKNNIQAANKAMLEVGSIYREGMPDRYDRRGNKIKGVPRDLSKAMHYFNQAYRYGNLQALLLMADMYHYDYIEENAIPGARENARKLYLQLSTSGNRYLEAVAKDRMLQMNEDDGIQGPRHAFTMGGIGIPAMLGDTLPSIQTRRQHRQEQPAIQPYRRLTQFEQITAGIPRRDRRNTARLDTPQVNQNAADNGLDIRNDPQNSHDHVVVNTIRESVRNLRNSTDTIYDLSTTLRDLRDYINCSDTSDQKRKDAVRTLDRIETSEGTLSGTNESESDVLHLVWNRIHNSINSGNKETLKHNLVNELAEGVEHGAVVCSRGRFNRIVDSLNKVDPAVDIKPKWVLQQEMLSKAATIRGDMMKSLSASDKQAIDSLEPNKDQEAVCGRFKNDLQAKIKSEFQREYVASGLMNAELLDAEVDRWIDHV